MNAQFPKRWLQNVTGTAGKPDEWPLSSGFFLILAPSLAFRRTLVFALLGAKETIKLIIFRDSREPGLPMKGKVGVGSLKDTIDFLFLWELDKVVLGGNQVE